MNYEDEVELQSYQHLLRAAKEDYKKADYILSKRYSLKYDEMRSFAMEEIMKYEDKINFKYGSSRAIS